MIEFTVILQRLADGETLSIAESEAAIAHFIDGGAPDAQIAAFLMALKLRGETVEEIVGGARALRARATPINAPKNVVDTCGTGGGWSSFNVSTAAAFVAAGAGAIVAKHGNRTVTRKSGSADVIEALGVDLTASLASCEHALSEVGLCFLFAPVHHSAMRHVAAARRALGLRTVFNILGPLANPAGARRQLIGVNEPRLLPLMAQALAELGAERAMIVHGKDGLDELTLTGPSTVFLLADGAISQSTVSPEDVGLSRYDREALEGGGPRDNATAIKAMLEGQHGPLRDIACLNAAAAVVLADVTNDLAKAVRIAQDAIDDGRAKAVLDGLVRITRRAGVHG